MANLDTPLGAAYQLAHSYASYRAVPDNVYLDAWFPRPSVVAKSGLFIHHGGNNGFCEAPRFGVPSLIMPLLPGQA